MLRSRVSVTCRRASMRAVRRVMSHRRQMGRIPVHLAGRTLSAALGVRFLSTVEDAAAKEREVAAMDDAAVEAEFDVIQSSFLKEHDAYGTLFRHKGTGAHLLAVEADPAAGGDEKVFGVSFRTPPGNSTGVAHILEHSVLCGSRKYPVREPFADLLRSSLQTFLNAFTYPDRTCYPVASLNTQDYYNLMDVYLDAVFHPKLSPMILQQEGWRFEPVEGDAGFHYSGVVYSEMKGVYSSPEALHFQAVLESLFHGHSYGVSSGGDPRHIPRLSFEAFQRFHQQWYRPSNALFFLFGDIDRVACLRRILPYLEEPTPVPPHLPQEDIAYPAGMVLEDVLGSSVAPRHATDAAVTKTVSQPPTAPVPEDGVVRPCPPWTAPRRIQLQYPAGSGVARTEQEHEEADDMMEQGAGTGNRHFASVNWALQDGGRPQMETAAAGAAAAAPPGEQEPLEDAERLGLGLANSLIMGQRTSPLFKALIESWLGSSVIGGGLSSSLRQSIFSAGLEGVGSMQDCQRVEDVVLQTLDAVTRQPFNPDHVEAELNTLEFGLREMSVGGTPKGLSLFLGAVGGWTYNGPIFRELQFEEALQTLKERMREDPMYLPGLLRRHLVDNPHRVTVFMAPDANLGSQWDAEEEERVRHATERLTPEERAGIVQAAEELHKRQTTPDPPQAVATIPRLQRSDLERTAPWLDGESFTVTPSNSNAQASPVRVWRYPQSTQGIVYMSLFFPLTRVRPEQVPLLSLFSRALMTLGTEQCDEVAMSHRVGSRTGGVDARLSARDLPRLGLGSDGVQPMRSAAVSHLVVEGKALEHQVDSLGGLLQEMLTDSNWGRRDLLLHHLREVAADHETAFLSSGGHASSWLRAQFSPAGQLMDTWGGLPNYVWTKQWLQELERGGPESEAAWVRLEEQLRSLARTVFQADYAGLSLTAGESALETATAAGLDLLTSLPSAGSDIETGHESDGKGTFPIMLHGAPSMQDERSSLPLLNPPPNSAPRAWEVPAQVNYVYKAGYLVPPESEAPLSFPGGAADVAGVLLQNEFLWETVRVQGNAYGVQCGMDPMTGFVLFGSYRDPNVASTLDAFDRAGAVLEEQVHDDMVDKAVMATMGSLDSPMTPAAKAGLHTRRALLGITQEHVQTRRDQMIDAKTQDIKAVGRAMRRLAEENESRAAAVVAPDSVSVKDGWKVERPLEE